MSRAHTRLLREINRRLAEERYYRGYVEADDYDDQFDDGDDGHQDCSVCGADLGCGGFHEYCSICGMPGCDACLIRGDDVFPYTCGACEGEDEIADLFDDEVEA